MPVVTLPSLKVWRPRARRLVDFPAVGNAESAPVRVVGRYALYGEIAAGGMATVHFGRLLGPVGFSRTVAIKRLHPQFAKDPEFVSMFLDEARLAARIRHPNVVPTLDVVATQGELFLVMDYVQGESLSKLIRIAREQGGCIPGRITAGILVGALHGLHAAHEAKNERGEKLNIVHRDISPQNVLVGSDGVTRVLDFGVAKAAGRIQTTREGQLKGKLAYMAPEQISGTVTRQTDVYAAAIVLWEALTGRRLFSGENEGHILAKVMGGVVEPPSKYVALPPGLDEVVLRGLQRDMTQRYATAREFAVAIERCTGIASSTETGEWVEAMAHVTLSERAEKVAEIESSSSTTYDASTMEGLNTSVAAGPKEQPSGGSQPFQPSSGVRATADPPVSQASQMSSISVSKPGEPTPARRNNTVLYAGILGAAFLLLSLAILVGAFTLRSGTPSTAGAATSDPKARPSATVAATPPPSATATATPQDTASGVAIGDIPSAKPTAKPPTGSATRPPVVTTSHPTAPVTSFPTAPPTTTAAPLAVNCDPPYTLDASGHKKWKPECLK